MNDNKRKAMRLKKNEEIPKGEQKLKLRKWGKIWIINMGGKAWKRIDNPYGFDSKKSTFEPKPMTSL